MIVHIWKLCCLFTSVCINCCNLIINLRQTMQLSIESHKSWFLSSSSTHKTLKQDLFSVLGQQATDLSTLLDLLQDFSLITMYPYLVSHQCGYQSLSAKLPFHPLSLSFLDFFSSFSNYGLKCWTSGSLEAFSQDYEITKQNVIDLW